ncbi:hypothetical protein [Vibrio sp.]|uniref:hypothetical protein n=1 Tax=Vibrio sp. TaxID=678 RepID=UPI003AA9BCCA
MTLRFHLSKYRTIWIFFLLVPITLLAGFYVPKVINIINTSNQVELPTDTSQYCALSTQQCKQQDVTITLDTDVAKPLEPTHIEVDWPDNQSDKLVLTLRGLDMDLGVVKFPIQKQKNSQFQGTIVLPICTYSKMTWIGTLTDQQGNKIYTSIRMKK